jgi:ubiquinone/menaquinone biosynthesis C-methylase UbiE
MRRFSDRGEFKAWNDAMVAKYDVDRFHAHPSPFVRYVEQKRIRRIFALLGARPADRVLEVGCGGGHLLAQLPAGRPFGLDLSAPLLTRAARRLRGRGVLVQADAEHLPFREVAWDRVYCSEVLEHIPAPGVALAELRRVLRRPGVAVVSVPNERLINALKGLLRKTGLSQRLLREGSGGYAMPDRMDEEWHLHTFDLRALRDLIPVGCRITAIERIPFRWLPLRYVVRFEVAG